MKCLSTLILKNTVMTYTILQVHIEPPGLALGTCFHLNCTHMHLEIAYSLPVIGREKAIGWRRLWRLDWGNRRLYGRDRTLINHRWRKGRLGSRGGTSLHRRGTNIRRLYRRRRA